MKTPLPGRHEVPLGIPLEVELHDGYCSAPVEAVLGFLKEVHHVRRAIQERGLQLSDAQGIQGGVQSFGVTRVDDVKDPAQPVTEGSEPPVMPVLNEVLALLESAGAMTSTGVPVHLPLSTSIVHATANDAKLEQAGTSSNLPHAGNPSGSDAMSTAAGSDPSSDGIERRSHPHVAGPEAASAPNLGTYAGAVDGTADDLVQSAIAGDSVSSAPERGQVATADLPTPHEVTVLPSVETDQQEGSENRLAAGSLDPNRERILRKVASGPSWVLLNGVKTPWSSNVAKASDCHVRKTPKSVPLQPVGTEVHCISSNHRRYHPQDPADAAAVEAGTIVIVESCSTEHMLFAGRDALILQRELELPEDDPAAS